MPDLDPAEPPLGPLPEPPVEPPARPRRSWPLGLLFGVLNFPAFLVLLGLGTLDPSETLTLLLPILLLVGEGGYGWWLRDHGRPFLGNALVLAPIFTFGIVAALVFLAIGYCLLVFNGSSWH